MSHEPVQHVEWLQEYLELGYDELYLHFVGQEQHDYLETFGEHVLPALSPTPPADTPSLEPSTEETR